jgi:uncharacterized repeat protein (TIGR01451 family)
MVIPLIESWRNVLRDVSVETHAAIVPATAGIAQCQAPTLTALRAANGVRAVVLAVALLLPGAAFAAIGVNKTFAPTNVSAGQISTLTVILINNNPTAALATAFADNLPGSVVVAATPNASTTCAGGTVTAAPGGNSFSLSGATIPAAVGLTAGTCTAQVDVQSPTAGVFINTIPAGAVGSSQGANAQDASATLTVAALRAVTGTKAFSVVLHGSTTLPAPTSRVTITLANPNGVALTNASLTDTLPAQLVMAPAANATTTCVGGTVATTATSATLSGATIPANGNCNFQFDVVAALPNAYSNGNATPANTIAANALTTTQGVTNTAAFTGNVTLQTGARVEKVFAPTPIVTGGTSTLTITVRNFNTSPLTGSIAFADALPGTMRVAAPLTTATTCAGLTFNPTLAAGDASFSVSGGSLPGATAGSNNNANCTVTILVTATNAGVNPVTLTNTVPVGNFGGVAFSSAAGNLVVNAVTSVGGSKTFSPAPVLQGQISTATITLTNSSPSIATITSFTDALTTMGASPQFTVAAAPTTTCGGAISFTGPPTNTITLGVGNSIPANGSCTITVPVQVAANAGTGARTNTIAQGALVTNQGRTQTTITGALTVNPVLSVGKTFAPTTVAAGADTLLTITLTRAAGATSLSGLAFTDTLPVGHVVSATPNLVNNCGGTVTAASGTNTIALAGGSLAGGAPATSCTILVNVTTPAGAGAATNTIPAFAVGPPQVGVTSSEGFVNPAAATATVTRVISNVTLNKSFNPATVLVGGQSTLTINILNTNANALALTAAALTDTLPSGMAIATPLATTNSCGGTLTGVAGGGSIALSNVSLAANATCTVTVKVVANASGNLIDTLPAGAFKSAQGVTNPLAAQATLAATGSADLSISKTDGLASVVPGTATTYTILVRNLGPNDVAGAIFKDPAVAGLNVTGVSCGSPTGGALCPTVANTTVAQMQGSGIVIPLLPGVPPVGGGSVTFTVNATVAAGATGSITNTATITPPGTVIDTIPGNNTASDTNTLTPQADLAIVKSGTASVSALGAITYTLTISNAGPSSANGATFSDAVPAGITGVAAVCGSPLGGAVCPGSVTVAGNNVSGTIPALPPGGSVVITITGTAPANAASLTNTGTVAVPPGVTDTNPGNNSSSTSTTVNPVADVAIVKSGPATVSAAGTITYLLTISNAGPSAANGATFSDAVPAGITGVAAACGSPLGGAACPASVTVTGNNVSGTIPSLPAGGSVVITITGTAPASGSVANSATVAPPSGTTDPVPGNNTSATITTTINPVADVAIVKTGPATVNAAGVITYTLTISNAGPSAADGATFSDAVPAGITGIAAVCGSPLGGAACPGSVTVAGNNVSGTIPTLPKNGSVVITITGTAPANGSVANTATVAPPSGTTDPVPGNNTSATITTTINPVADVAVVKTGPATVNAGGTITYQLTISNAGPSAADGATFSDAVPAGITGIAAVCGSPLGGAACPGSVTVAGNNVSGTIPTLPKNGSVVITITGTAPANATSFTNTATVAPPSGTTDPTPGNNSSSVPTNVTAVADLAITKTDGVTSVVPGTSTTYTIVVTNNGPSNVTGATVVDNLPAAIASATWTAIAAGGATGFTVSGSGNIADTVDMPLGSTITYTVVANIASSATGTLVNIASVSVPPGTTDPVGGNNSATDTNTLVPQVTLAVVKTDGSTTYTPGGTAIYMVTVTNSGPSDAADVGVLDGLPPGLTLTALVTCTATGNATCAPVTSALGGTGFTMTGARIAAGLGNSLVFTVPVAFASSMTAPSVTNTAVATDAATGATASGADTNTLAPNVTLAVTKDDGSLTYTPGGTATYKVTITHGGLSDATNVMISDPLPAGVTLTASATCVAVGTANCGTVTGTSGQSSFGATGASIAAGPGNSLVFTAPVAFAASLATDPLDNTATATDVLSGATGQGTDRNQRAAQVTLAMTKDDGSPTYTPGGTAIYVVTVANTGASDALNVSVDDTLPIGVLLTGTVTCAVTGSAVCGTVTGSAGQGAFNAVGARINAGAGNSLKFTVPVAFASSLADNPLINTATVQDLASNATGSASDSNTLARQADLTIAKDDGVTIVVPGGMTTYTIVATNAGPSDVAGAKVLDTLPAAIVGATWTAVATGGATGFTPSGAGNISDTVDMPAGSKITYTLVAMIGSGATGTVSNTASIATPVGVTDPNPANNSATDTNSLAAQADLAITKTDGVTTVEPGGTTTYTIVVTNSGPSDAVGATVSDPLPAAITVASYTATATGGATGFTAGGAGSIADTVNMPAGSTITYTLIATISATATGTLTNTAAVSPPATVTDPNPGNNSATDTNTLTPTADLSISKTDGITSMAQGGSTTYTIVVANAGPSAVVGATISDPMPASLATMTYTAVGSGGASGFTASGSGSIGDIVTLPLGGTITYTVQATLKAAAIGTLTNTAAVTPPAGVTDPTPGNNSATDVNTIVPTPQADLGITKTDGSATYTPGATITYTIVASNAGPANVTGATVVDVPPAVISGATWTCTGAGGGTCPASGAGNLNVLVNLPVGASVTFLLTGTISPGATGNLSNTATVSVPPGVVDPNPGNNSATDVNTPNAVAGLSIAKVADSPTYTPGGTGTYTVTVGNIGPSNAGNVNVTDNLPAGVTLNGTPTCVATGAATCGTLTGTAGSTAFTASGATIAAGAGNRLVYTLPVRFAATLSTNPLVNLVSANDPASQSVATSSASSTLVFPGPPPQHPVPADNRWALALLVALILAGTWRAGRRRPT